MLALALATCRGSAWLGNEQPGSVYQGCGRGAAAMLPAKIVFDKRCRVQQHGKLCETRQIVLFKNPKLVFYAKLTLWNIRDGEETVEFMTSFYEKCLAGLPVRQAFREAQGEMRRKYGDVYFWAAFK